MKYFKHGDKVKCLFGRVHDRLQGEFEWNTEEHQEIGIRITKDYTNNGQIIVGLEDFNINYPEDVYQETEDDIIFSLFNFAFHILKEGKEFEVEQNLELEKNVEKALSAEGVIGEKLEIKTGSDTHLMDLINILKSLSVKKVIFEDGNEIEIN